jgi:hypothetical protein
VARSGRTVKKPAYQEHYVLSAMSCSDDNPQSYTLAVMTILKVILKWKVEITG